MSSLAWLLRRKSTAFFWHMQILYTFYTPHTNKNNNVFIWRQFWQRFAARIIFILSYVIGDQGSWFGRKLSVLSLTKIQLFSFIFFLYWRQLRQHSARINIPRAARGIFINNIFIIYNINNGFVWRQLRQRSAAIVRVAIVRPKGDKNSLERQGNKYLNNIDNIFINNVNNGFICKLYMTK